MREGQDALTFGPVEEYKVDDVVTETEQDLPGMEEGRPLLV